MRKNTIPPPITWPRLLIRSGFRITVEDEQIVIAEDDCNLVYLKKILEKRGLARLEGKRFFPNSEQPDERAWLSSVEESHSSGETSMPFYLEIMDTYMAGIVRWINEIGIRTIISCDGHGKEEPFIKPSRETNIRLTYSILGWFDRRWKRRDGRIKFFSGRFAGRKDMLNTAEWLYDHQKELSEAVKMLRESPYLGNRRAKRPHRE